MLKGPLVLAFSKDDPGAAARVVKDFAKDERQAQSRPLVSLGGQVLPAEDLEKVASLPTREQALVDADGRHEGTDPEVRRHACGATGSKLVRTLAAVRDQKQAAGA